MYGIKISRPGFSARTASDVNLVYSSDFKTPKIIRVAEFPNGSTAHGLGYTPAFITYANFAGLEYNTSVTVDSTNVTCYGTQIVVLFSDALGGESTSTVSGSGVVVTPDGKLKKSGLSVYSGFDTFKIAKTGTITLEVPQEELGTDDFPESEYTESLSHGIGYRPMYFPFVRSLGILDIAGSFNVNDWLGSPSYFDGSGGNLWEYVNINTTNDLLVMSVSRGNYATGSRVFPARTITLYYTLFYNKIDEDFNAFE